MKKNSKIELCFFFPGTGKKRTSQNPPTYFFRVIIRFLPSYSGKKNSTPLHATGKKYKIFFDSGSRQTEHLFWNLWKWTYMILHLSFRAFHPHFAFIRGEWTVCKIYVGLLYRCKQSVCLPPCTNKLRTLKCAFDDFFPYEKYSQRVLPARSAGEKILANLS